MCTHALPRDLSVITAEREKLEERARMAEALEREIEALKDRSKEVTHARTTHTLARSFACSLAYWQPCAGR